MCLQLKTDQLQINYLLKLISVGNGCVCNNCAKMVNCKQSMGFSFIVAYSLC